MTSADDERSEATRDEPLRAADAGTSDAGAHTHRPLAGHARVERSGSRGASVSKKIFESAPVSAEALGQFVRKIGMVGTPYYERPLVRPSRGAQRRWCCCKHGFTRVPGEPERPECCDECRRLRRVGRTP